MSLGLNEPAEAVEFTEVEDAESVELASDEVDAELVAYVEALQAENAELRRVAVEASNAARQALAVAQSAESGPPERLALSEMAGLVIELEDARVDALRDEIARFRLQVAKSRRRRWFR